MANPWDNDPWMTGAKQSAPAKALPVAAAVAAPWANDAWMTGSPPVKSTQQNDGDHRLASIAANLPTTSVALGGAPLAPSNASIPGLPTVSDVKNFLNALGHNAMNLPHGAAQLVENGLAKGASLLPDNPVSRYLINTAAQDNAAMRQREQQYQQQTPTNPSSVAGAIVGGTLPFLTGGDVATGLKALGNGAGNLTARIPLIGKALAPVLDAATQGAAVGAASPVTNGGQDYWTDKAKQTAIGGAIGGAVGGSAAGIAKAAKAARPIIQPTATAADTFANVLANGDPMQAQTLANALRGTGPAPAGSTINFGSTELVPGSQPTLAEIANDPSLVAIQKVLGNRPGIGTQFQNRLNSNNAARWAVINGVAGDDAAMQAAIAARRAAAQPAIEQLLTNGNPVETAPVLKAIGDTQASPFGVNDLINTGLSKANNAIRSHSLPVTEAGPTILDANGNALNAPAQQPSSIMPDQLDAVRQKLRNYINDLSSNGPVVSKEEVGLNPIKNAITDAIEQANPGYRDYLATYAKNSVPINTMEAGQSIASDLGDRALNAVGDPLLTLSGYRGAFNRALNNAEYGIDPAAEQKLGNVLLDLQRQSKLNSQASAYGGGSATAPNLYANDWLGQQLFGGGSPSLLSNLSNVPYLGKVANAWDQLSTQRAANALADMFLNPTTSGANALDQYAQQANDPTLNLLFSRLPMVPSSLNTIRFGQTGGQP